MQRNIRFVTFGVIILILCYQVPPTHLSPYHKGNLPHSPKNPELRESNGVVRSRFFTLTEKQKADENTLVDGGSTSSLAEVAKIQGPRY